MDELGLLKVADSADEVGGALRAAFAGEIVARPVAGEAVSASSLVMSVQPRLRRADVRWRPAAVRVAAIAFTLVTAGFALLAI